MFESGRLPSRYDIFHCIVNIPEGAVRADKSLGTKTGDQVNK